MTIVGAPPDGDFAQVGVGCDGVEGQVRDLWQKLKVSGLPVGLHNSVSKEVVKKTVCKAREVQLRRVKDRYISRIYTITIPSIQLSQTSVWHSPQ